MPTGMEIRGGICDQLKSAIAMLSRKSLSETAGASRHLRIVAIFCYDGYCLISISLMSLFLPSRVEELIRYLPGGKRSVDFPSAESSSS